MSLWTPDRYLELARLCRDASAKGSPPRRDFLRSMADEYEEKAASGGSLCERRLPAP
jgi:hypothetical protein